MTKTRRTLTVALAALGLAACWSTAARADDDDYDSTVVPAERVAPAEPRSYERDEYRPNPYMLQSGIIIFGISYGASAVVAAESDRDSDQALWIPVAGPWMDLAQRSDQCPQGQTDAPGCRNEDANKVMLVVSGVFQAIGALDIVAAFLFPPTAAERTAANTKPRLAFAPFTTGTSYGLGAAGTF